MPSGMPQAPVVRSDGSRDSLKPKGERERWLVKAVSQPPDGSENYVEAEVGRRAPLFLSKPEHSQESWTSQR
jgi:hypothetical protein